MQSANNGMHPTADTPLLKFRHRRGAAGNAGRSAATLDSRCHLEVSRNYELDSSGSRNHSLRRQLRRPRIPRRVLGAAA